MSNSIDPDETAHYEPSHLGLCRLQKTIFIAYDSERVNRLDNSSVTIVSAFYHFISFSPSVICTRVSPLPQHNACLW